MVTISLQHGTSGDSAYGYAHLGVCARRVFHRYAEGYRFAKLACDLVEKHGFIANQRNGLRRGCGESPSGRSRSRPRSISVARAFAPRLRRVIRSSLAIRCIMHIACLLLRNDPLDRCGASRRWRWTSPERSSTRDAADIIIGQQRFIATMQGRTATFSTFSDAQFDEATFEAQLSGAGRP